MNRTKVLILAILLPIFSIVSYSQENGSPILKVYADFYKGLSENDNSTAFEVSRVYLGYKGNINEYFSAEAKLDIGSPEDQSQYSLVRRYAYFKTAYIKYEKNKLSLLFGLFGMMQFEEQEKNWGYRYISKSFMDEYKYGPSADIGFAAIYRLNDYIKADITFSNGEGYKNLQSDNNYKSAVGISFFPIENTTIRFYYDILKKETTQTVFASYLGYKTKKYRLGAEWNMLFNKSYVPDQNLKGVSIYGTYTINDQWAIFGRHDRLNSNILPEDTQPWNIYQDGSSITTGIEYSPVKNVKCAFNYQDWYSYAANGADKSYIFFNVEFKL